ncbi:MAG TPA: hypothetical protein VG295_13110 [Solirubrobacteraceae bacterium]|nr:hypothetical protein [Solirubrobacteraceae bacterium]
MALVLEVTPQPPGPELPEPSPPIDPGPGLPDVPSPDPRGPETPDSPIEPDPPLPTEPAQFEARVQSPLPSPRRRR